MRSDRQVLAGLRRTAERLRVAGARRDQLIEQRAVLCIQGRQLDVSLSRLGAAAGIADPTLLKAINRYRQRHPEPKPFRLLGQDAKPMPAPEAAKALLTALRTVTRGLARADDQLAKLRSTRADLMAEGRALPQPLPYAQLATAAGTSIENIHRDLRRHRQEKP